MERNICVFQDFLTQAHRERIDAAARAAKMHVRYFATGQFEEAKEHLQHCEVLYAQSPQLLRAAPPTLRWYAAAFAQFPRISWRGHCMYCGHCAPCPVGIDVASVLKFLNLAKAQGTLPETVREHYALLEHPAGACISCGSCEQRCPFGVQVMEHMRQAREVFGK